MNWMDAWLFPVGSVLLGGAGLLVLVRGLFGRRFAVRKTRACRRCRYDMTSTEGHRCPECGHTAKHEGEHYAGRRRWLVAGLGLVLLVGAVAGSRWNEIRTAGWWAVMPTGVQLALAPYSGDERLWEYLGRACSANLFSPAQQQGLRDVVMRRLLDPDADASNAMLTVRHALVQRRRPDPLVSREDLARVAREGSPSARAFAVEMLGYPIPTSQEEIDVRRQAWRESTPANQREVLKWIAQHAIGEGDLAILRQAMQNDPWRASLLYQSVAEESTGGLRPLLAEMLNDPNSEIRLAAARSHERWMGNPEDRPPVEVQRRLVEMMADDPDIRMPDTIDRFLDEMSPEVGPEIGAALLRTTDQHRFNSFMFGIRRKDDPSIVPSLILAAKQPERPIEQRFDAADGAMYVWARTRNDTGAPRPDPSDPEMLAFYGSVIDAIRDGDPSVLLTIGRQNGLQYNSWGIRAIGERAMSDGVGPYELNAWLSTGGLGEVLLMSEPGATSPMDAIKRMLGEALQEEAVDADETLRAIAGRWFPELIGVED